jgi:hypothetical protein
MQGKAQTQSCKKNSNRQTKKGGVPSNKGVQRENRDIYTFFQIFLCCLVLIFFFMGFLWMKNGDGGLWVYGLILIILGFEIVVVF